jgi:hypothetical protein
MPMIAANCVRATNISFIAEITIHLVVYIVSV